MLQVEIFCYALSPSDNSEWRQRIERESENFLGRVHMVCP